MNIFNAIKYPIHLPITGEKLDTLPLELYKRWAEFVVLNEDNHNRPSKAFFNVHAFAAYFNDIPEELRPFYVEELRKLILEIGE